jgi:hypothetical protein
MSDHPHIEHGDARSPLLDSPEHTLWGAVLRQVVDDLALAHSTWEYRDALRSITDGTVACLCDYLGLEYDRFLQALRADRKPRPCPVCGRPVEIGARGQRSLYCGGVCRRKASQRRR